MAGGVASNAATGPTPRPRIHVGDFAYPVIAGDPERWDPVTVQVDAGAGPRSVRLSSISADPSTCLFRSDGMWDRGADLMLIEAAVTPGISEKGACAAQVQDVDTLQLVAPISVPPWYLMSIESAAPPFPRVVREVAMCGSPRALPEDGLPLGRGCDGLLAEPSPCLSPWADAADGPLAARAPEAYTILGAGAPVTHVAPPNNDNTADDDNGGALPDIDTGAAFIDAITILLQDPILHTPPRRRNRRREAESLLP